MVLKSIPVSRSYYDPMVERVVVDMSVDDWIKVKRNPKQRNEEARANRRHLSSLSKVHSIVIAAVTPSGTLYKIDGHTRAFKWKNGTLGRPSSLTVVIYMADDLNEVKSLYDTADSDLAVKKACDKAQSGAAEAGLKFSTDWLAQGSFSNMLKTAAKMLGIPSKDVTTLVPIFEDALVLLDGLDTKQKGAGGFNSGVAAAAIISLHKFGAAVVPFWKLYSDRLGLVDGLKRDPVMFLLDEVQTRSLKRQLAGVGNNLDVAIFALSCLERWRRGRHGGVMNEKRPTRIDISLYR